MKAFQSPLFAWVAALLLAAIVPATITAIVSWDVRVLPLAFVITLGHALILGLPVALFYRDKGWNGFVSVIAGSAIIGMLPGGLLGLTSLFGGSASVDNVPTVVAGLPTLAGWLQYLMLLGILGGLGATGGATFWLTFRALGETTLAGPRPADPPNPTRSGVWLAAAATMATIGIAAIPSINKDRSCHNLFRDGRTPAAPQLNIDLDISIADWPRLTNLLKTFATAHGMSFRDSSEAHRGSFEALGVSVCNETGQAIMANDLRFASQRYAPIDPGRGVPVDIFELHGSLGWRPLAQSLVAALDKAWPGKVRFIDREGDLTSDPPILTVVAKRPPADK